ncbi:TPA: hypothetical protein IAC10_03875 [Candidatus Scatousia excrementigallinarum]|uniref:Uncharacterized protein n=1 Tax=Candidatus Scatousia excrementigallinarum TaxID=2840935 RepID=A0A9D1EYL2_9BACT|nr:hypothetical protein [Candidatus Scatousia excrementigallinarum]
MSGFDVNVLSTKPIIREAANMQNDGGGGNLGYMQQGEGREEEKKKQAFDESIFKKKNEFDSFVFEKDLEGFEDDGFSVAKFIAKVILSVKDFFKIK